MPGPQPYPLRIPSTAARFPRQEVDAAMAKLNLYTTLVEDPMVATKRELSWSLSRARMFQECARRYYYHSYLAKAGYVHDAPADAGYALEMRSLKGLDMWVGEIVHEVIQWTLEQARTGALPSLDEARAETRRRLSEGWKGSVKQLWRTDAQSYPSLFDHYYRLPYSPATISRIKDKAFLSITNFMQSEVLERILATRPEDWLPIDRYASFRIDGLLFYLKFDFALRLRDRLVIYDWKTGNPSPDIVRQLACYAMYTSSRWRVPIETIRVCAVHLQPELQCVEQMADEELIEEAKDYVTHSFASMLRCLRDPERDLAAQEDFPMTGNLLRCVRCNFRGICSQGIAATGTVDDEDCDRWE